MGKLRLTVITIAALLSITVAKAQDPQTSQFFANPNYLNPALVGTANQYRAVVSHRQQWGGYNTSSFSFDAMISENKTGWGFLVMQDNQLSGTIRNTMLNASVGHRVELAEDQYIGIGLQAGIYQHIKDWSKLIFEDQLPNQNGNVNPTGENLNSKNSIHPDISIGAVYYSDNLFAGASYGHVNKPLDDNGETLVERKITLHGGAMLEMTGGKRQSYYLSPNIIYQKQGSFHYLNTGMYYSQGAIVGGLWYRWNDAVIFMAGFNHEKFKIGYSYDMTVSELSTVNSNSHEISLTYLFSASNKIKANFYKGKCPAFQKHLF